MPKGRRWCLPPTKIRSAFSPQIQPYSLVRESVVFAMTETICWPPPGAYQQSVYEFDTELSRLLADDYTVTSERHPRDISLTGPNGTVELYLNFHDELQIAVH